MITESTLNSLDIARDRVNGDLPRLSACSTASPGARLLMMMREEEEEEEVIHLTFEFQLADHRHIVGTCGRWPIRLLANSLNRLHSALVQNGAFNGQMRVGYAPDDAGGTPRSTSTSRWAAFFIWD